jgi:hypothetical protein
MKNQIMLDEAYTDNDYKIYFDRQSLLAHVTELEDDNLFKITLV